MKIEQLHDIPDGEEHIVLEDKNPGFYLVNDSLWLVDNNSLVIFIWSQVSSYLSKN